MSKLPLPLFGQPSPHALFEAHLVGRYALGATWADNHGSIYPFDELRRGCPCGGCAALPSLSVEMTWPREVKRLTEGLGIVWSDGHESHYPFPTLRELCRCAGCAGGH